MAFLRERQRQRYFSQGTFNASHWCRTFRALDQSRSGTVPKPQRVLMTREFPRMPLKLHHQQTQLGRQQTQLHYQQEVVDALRNAITTSHTSSFPTQVFVDALRVASRNSDVWDWIHGSVETELGLWRDEAGCGLSLRRKAQLVPRRLTHYHHHTLPGTTQRWNVGRSNGLGGSVVPPGQGQDSYHWTHQYVVAKFFRDSRTYFKKDLRRNLDCPNISFYLQI